MKIIKKYIKYIIPVIASLIIFTFFMITGKDSKYQLVDAFTVTGFIVLLFSCLLFVAGAGAFDLLIYGVRKLINSFRRYNPNGSLPKTFHEYRTINSEKEKIDLKGGIAVGLLFLIVGLIIGMIQGVW